MTTPIEIRPCPHCGEQRIEHALLDAHVVSTVTHYVQHSEGSTIFPEFSDVVVLESNGERYECAGCHAVVATSQDEFEDYINGAGPIDNDDDEDDDDGNPMEDSRHVDD